jgi:hypothetical protein
MQSHLMKMVSSRYLPFQMFENVQNSVLKPKKDFFRNPYDIIILVEKYKNDEQNKTRDSPPLFSILVKKSPNFDVCFIYFSNHR